MGKRLKHRIPRLFRAATVIVWAVQGLFAPWLQAPVYAANPDTMTLGVTPISYAPPGVITDLLASPNLSASGQISLSWTAPQGIEGILGQVVGSYEIHYATYSVDSLLGNTTSWWNDTIASSTTLQPPGYIPQPPGSPEAYTMTGLTPGVTYYFGIKSTSIFGVLSIIDTESSTPGDQAYAIASDLVSTPTGFTGTATSTGSINWSWNPSTGAVDYEIYSDPGDVLLQTLAAPTTSWSQTGLAINTAYSEKVQASNSSETSGYSNVATVYTLAATPTSLAVTGVTANSISLSWNVNGNPTGTNFGLERSLDGVTFSQITLTTASSYQDTGLTNNTQYYYRLRAFNGSNIPTAYTATVSATTGAQAATTPQTPTGVVSTVISNGNQAMLSWQPVTLDTNGNPITIDHYVVSRYQAIGASTMSSVNVQAPATTFTDTTGGLDYFYTVQAVATGGGVSQASDYLDAQGNRYAVASDDLNTRVVMPTDAASYLVKGNNPFGDNIEIVLIHQPQNEINNVLRSYQIVAQLVSSGQTVTPFSFPSSDVSVQLGLGASVSGSSHSSLTAQQTAQIGAGSIAQIVSVFWFNGMNFVKVGDPTLTSGQAAIAVTVRNIGIYQVQMVTLATQFQLTQGSPYPRVITPNGRENHRVFFFFDNPTGDIVTGSIYDIRGAKVRDLQVNSMSPAPNCIVWDGHDNQGSVVPSGVYLYKLSTTGGSITGTVVVAR